MDMNGQLHTPAALLAGKEPLSAIEQEDGWVSEPVWYLTGNQNTDHTTDSLVTVSTELQQSMCVLMWYTLNCIGNNLRHWHSVIGLLKTYCNRIVTAQFCSPRGQITSLYQLERLLRGQRKLRSIMCDCPLLCQKGMTVCVTSATLPAHKMATLQTLRYLIEETCTEGHLYKVVDNQHTPKIHRFPVLHDPGAEHFNKVGIAETDRQRRERTAHQHPVFHTWICK